MLPVIKTYRGVPGRFVSGVANYRCIKHRRRLRLGISDGAAVMQRVYGSFVSACTSYLP